MIKMSDLVIDATATLGQSLYAIRAVPTYAYSDGVRTNKRDGTRYTIAVARLGMQSISVKVLGSQEVEVAQGEAIPVVLEDPELYIYYHDGKPMVGGRAGSIKRLVD